jgi:hypothetical protein
MKACLSFLVCVFLSAAAFGQNLHVLDQGTNNGVFHNVYCLVPPDHSAVTCSISVSPIQWGSTLSIQGAYLTRNQRIIPLQVKSEAMGGQEATAPVIYGDWMIIRWVGGQYALQIGRGWTRDQWDNYAQRLVALSDLLKASEDSIKSLRRIWECRFPETAIRVLAWGVMEIPAHAISCRIKLIEFRMTSTRTFALSMPPVAPSGAAESRESSARIVRDWLNCRTN